MLSKQTAPPSTGIFRRLHQGVFRNVSHGRRKSLPRSIKRERKPDGGARIPKDTSQTWFIHAANEANCVPGVSSFLSAVRRPGSMERSSLFGHHIKAYLVCTNRSTHTLAQSCGVGNDNSMVQLAGQTQARREDTLRP